MKLEFQNGWKGDEVRMICAHFGKADWVFGYKYFFEIWLLNFCVCLKFRKIDIEVKE